MPKVNWDDEGNVQMPEGDQSQILRQSFESLEQAEDLATAPLGKPLQHTWAGDEIIVDGIIAMGMMKKDGSSFE